MSAKIAVDELRVGMFVYLDLGWWAHPFALSSFKLTSPDQIATIRGLGLIRSAGVRRKVRSTTAMRALAAAANDGAVAQAVEESASLRDAAQTAVHTLASATAATGSTPDMPAALGASPRRTAARRAPPRVLHERRAQLAAQREASRVCTRQYGEAASL